MEPITSPPPALADLPLPVLSVADDGEVLAWNAAAAAATGWAAGEVVGRRDPPFVPPGGLEPYLRLAAAAAGGAAAPLALGCRRRDGGALSWTVHAAPLAGARRAAVLVADAPGASAREHHQAILDAVPAPIWFKDARGIYLGCNAAFEAFLGRARAELVGRTVFEIAPPDLAAIYKRTDDALLAARGTQEYEAQVAWPDGTRRDVVFRKAVIRDAGGGVAGLAGTMLDVTEQRAAERLLRAALADASAHAESFRRLVDGSPDLVIVHREGRVLYANEVCLRLVGRRLPEMVGEPLLPFVHPDDRAAVGERLSGSGPASPLELRVADGRGGWRWTEFLGIAIELDGAPARVAIGRDLTERKEAQARLAMTERLATIGTLAAGVAHELNNPLAFVRANLVWAMEELAAEQREPAAGRREEARRALADAAEGTERMRVIVRDLRALATGDDTRALLDLQRVLAFVVKLAAPVVEARARVVVDLPPLPGVLGSEARLGQVFLNLLVNAAHAVADAAPERSEIRIRGEPAGDRVVVAVSDNGAGIPPEIRSRIFDPFFTTKPPGVGTGLGLWVCHNIVTAHGGTIDVESAPGRGTTFRVALPAAR